MTMLAAAPSAAVALVGSLFFALGAALQQHVAATANEPRLLVLLRRPRWVLGGAVIAAGGLLHVYALSIGPLTIVQPMGVASLLFALPHRRRAERAQDLPARAGGGSDGRDRPDRAGPDGPGALAAAEHDRRRGDPDAGTRGRRRPPLPGRRHPDRAAGAHRPAGRLRRGHVRRRVHPDAGHRRRLAEPALVRPGPADPAGRGADAAAEGVRDRALRGGLRGVAGRRPGDRGVLRRAAAR